MVNDRSDNSLFLFALTPNGAPIAFFQKVSELYPELDFEVEFHGEEKDENGLANIQNGECSIEKLPPLEDNDDPDNWITLSDTIETVNKKQQ